MQPPPQILQSKIIINLLSKLRMLTGQRAAKVLLIILRLSMRVRDRLHSH